MMCAMTMPMRLHGPCHAALYRIRPNEFPQKRFISTQSKQWLAKQTEKLKYVMKEYGKIAVVFHGSLFATTLGATYSCIKMGFDVRHAKIPFVDMKNIDPNAGSLFFAYLVTLATGPIRGGITIVATPWIARVLKRRV